MKCDVKNPPSASPDVVLFVSGLLFPFLILSVFINIFHYNDVGIFAQWAECWKADASKVYELCRYANYPFLGMVFSAGLISKLKDMFQLNEFVAAVVYFRAVLAAVDALNFVLLVAIARALNIQYPVRVALMIAALPSSWAGGAIWGQIDNISQFFVLVGLFGLMRAYQTAPEAGLRSLAYFLVALLSLVAGLLTKQLAIFSIAALTPLAIAVLFRFRSAPKFNRLLAGGCILAGAGFFLILDRQIDISGFFGSSYLYVWLGGGSHHYRKIAGDGFNIWVLLDRPPGSPSDVPFYNFSLFGHELRFTPFATGLVFFGLYTLLVSQSFFHFARRKPAPHGESQTLIFLACCILYLAMINLGFNVLLTGTNERYLYHFYPFLLLSAFVLASSNAFARSSMIGLYVATSVLYGAYVLSCISPGLDWLAPVLQPRFLAVVHGALLAVLVVLGFRPAEGDLSYSRVESPRARAPGGDGSSRTVTSVTTPSSPSDPTSTPSRS